MRGTTLCSVSGPRKMVRPASNLRTNVQLTWRWVGSTLGASVANIRQRAYGRLGIPCPLPGRKAPNMTVSELIEELRAMPSQATVMLWSRMDDPQTPQSTKGRAFHDEIRPNRRNRCALLITFRINAPIQARQGIVNHHALQSRLLTIPG
jgi:hypothetical protein